MAFIPKLKQYGKLVLAHILRKPPRATVVPEVAPPNGGQQNFPPQPGLQQPPPAHFPWFRRTFTAVHAHADFELTALRWGTVNYTAVGGQRKQYPLVEAVAYWFIRIAILLILFSGAWLVAWFGMILWQKIKYGVWFCSTGLVG